MRGTLRPGKIWGRHKMNAKQRQSNTAYSAATRKIHSHPLEEYLPTPLSSRVCRLRISGAARRTSPDQNKELHLIQLRHKYVTYHGFMTISRAAHR